MKSLRLVAMMAFGLTLGAALMHAEPAKSEPAKAAPAKGKCCAKKEAAGEKCTHECCTAAAKDGKNCEKCGGKN
jgi:hypothetical protein